MTFMEKVCWMIEQNTKGVLAMLFNTYGDINAPKLLLMHGMLNGVDILSKHFNGHCVLILKTVF